MSENGSKGDRTLRQLLAIPRQGAGSPLSPPFSWDTDVSKPTASLSPISNCAQDLGGSGSSQCGEMPVTSTHFQWPGGSPHSITTASRNANHSSSSLNEVSSNHSLNDWTHFEGSINSLHSSEQTSHFELKALLSSSDPDNESAEQSQLLRQILASTHSSDLKGEEIKPVRYMNESPNSHQDFSLMPTFTEISSGNSSGSNKRKIEETDEADQDNPPKLSDKNRLLAGLLQNTPRQPPEILPSNLPAPKPGDLPQNSLPKDLNSRILPAPGQRSSNRNAIADFLNMDHMGLGRNGQMVMDPMDTAELFSILGELQDSDLAAADQQNSNPLTPSDKLAIDNIKQQLLQDILPGGASSFPNFAQDSIPYRENTLVSPGPMVQKYSSMNGPSPTLVRQMSQPNAFPPTPDGMMQMPRLAGPGGHMLIPNQMSSASRPSITSPVPTSMPLPGQAVRHQLRLNSYQKQLKAQQQGAGAGVNQQQGGIQMSNGPPNVTLSRTISMPNPAGHPGSGYAVMNGGYQNVPQVGMATQPLSPRHPNVPSRMMRPGGMQWIQQPQLQSMSPTNGPSSYASQQFSAQQQQLMMQQQQQQQQQSSQQAMQQHRFQTASAAAQQQAMQMQQQASATQDGFSPGAAQFYPRGPVPVQQRMTHASQNTQMMRSAYANGLSDTSDPNFANFQMNGVLSSSPAALNQQQQQFRWDMQAQANQSASGGMVGGTATRITTPSMQEQSFQQQFDFFDSSNAGSTMNGLSQNQQMVDQQYRVYSADSQQAQIGQSSQQQQQQQQQQSQQNNQQYGNLLSSSSSSGDLMSMSSHPGSTGHSHHQPGNNKSLLQQLLSETTPG
ncbi:hypothetical protein RvY_08799-2 [Ramazzottius varieornatus]|uniref:Uncharacterized protein n=1 Tax=Ramazzottius varieornatus TaxID=947166 RepID=A0A1D1VGA6_RAMVA|nr:hypothetical protein RvY_08799-2 [Ramazzottius varieornatus]